MQDFEKLGVFYLGRAYDPGARRATDELVLYDSKDLVTHAVCVGMTGSGKTGLCISILEEAAIDGIPAIVIDPKGDLANLLLTFPELRAADFRPWVNEEDARRKGLTADAFAEQQAETWRKGLASWEQDGARVRRLREAAEFTVYTPGSSAGVGVSILKSFAAPSRALRDDPEALRERVATTATSLLGLLGVDADPIQSREHVLLSTILVDAWGAGRDLDLPALIRLIQEPPVRQVGVLDVESFYPAKDRFALAMRLNNLLAAPGFGAWLEGEPLDVAGLLHTPAGKPRVAIFSIAHLGDAERMFFVSLLLNEVLGWMRQQPGTGSLRALVYMDEIYGFFPPTADPPSKRPLLTLMKQARAFGVGVMLATQNPVDLDYKGLGNAGTWFIGRLQTDRDKQRLLDGLEGAASGQGGAAAFDRAAMERTLAGLGSRVFLMNNVHEDAPVVFETRWAMSYLRGPLTRDQIRTLRESAPAPAAPTLATSQRGEAAARTAPTAATPARPVLAPGVNEGFVPLRSNPPAGATLVYRPALFGCATVDFSDTRAGVDTSEPVMRLVALPDDGGDVDWSRAADADFAEADLGRAPASDVPAAFAPLPPGAGVARSYDAWKKSLADALYRGRELTLLRSPALKETSRPGESERDFRVRLQQAFRERRDAEAEALRRRYAPRLASLEDRIRRAEQAVAREREQASASTWQTAISVGSTVLGAFLGRKRVSAGTIGRATTAARGASRTYKESQDVARAAENVQALRAQLAALQAEFDADAERVALQFDPHAEAFETVTIRPKKSGITVRSLTLAWLPHWTSAGGETPAWQ